METRRMFGTAVNVNSAKALTAGRKSKTTISICRRGSIVKERCNQLMEIIWQMGSYKQILDSDLTDLIKMYIGGNRDTIRDYKGYNGKVVHGRNGSRVVGVQREGYLEIFGYARRFQHGKIWQLHHELVPLPYHYEETLVPEKPTKGHNTYSESSEASTKEDSLSSILQGKGNRETISKVSPNGETVERPEINNNTTVRERNS